jgi:hypothetical protein
MSYVICHKQVLPREGVAGGDVSLSGSLVSTSANVSALASATGSPSTDLVPSAQEPGQVGVRCNMYHNNRHNYTD